jgi:hypothetical protein
LFAFDLGTKTLKPITNPEYDVSNLVREAVDAVFLVQRFLRKPRNILASVNLVSGVATHIVDLPPGTVCRLKYNPKTKQFLVLIQDKVDNGPQGVPHHSTAYLISKSKISKIATKVFDGEFDSNGSTIWLTNWDGVSAFDIGAGRVVWSQPVPAGAEMVVSECLMPNGQLLLLGYDTNSLPLLWQLSGKGRSLKKLRMNTKESDGTLPSAWFTPPQMYFDVGDQRIVIHWTVRMASYEAKGSDEVNLSTAKLHSLSPGTYVCRYWKKVISFDRDWVGEPRGQVPHYRKLLVDQLVLESSGPQSAITRLTPKNFEVRECVVTR